VRPTLIGIGMPGVGTWPRSGTSGMTRRGLRRSGAGPTATTSVAPPPVDCGASPSARPTTLSSMASSQRRNFVRRGAVCQTQTHRGVRRLSSDLLWGPRRTGMSGPNDAPPRCRVGLAVPLALVAAACSEEPVRSGILITMDTTNFDALDCYASTPGVTPFLAELASECVVYDRAHTVAPVPLPAHASMLTGLYPLRPGVRDVTDWKLCRLERRRRRARAGRRLRDRRLRLLERARGPSASIEGFRVYDAPTDSRRAPCARSRAELEGHARRRVALALGAIARSPFFLWVHFFDPHFPREPAPHYLVQGRGVPYLGEVAAMDASIGELVASALPRGRARRVAARRARRPWRKGSAATTPTHSSIATDDPDVRCSCAIRTVCEAARAPTGRRAASTSSRRSSRRLRSVRAATSTAGASRARIRRRTAASTSSPTSPTSPTAGARSPVGSRRTGSTCTARARASTISRKTPTRPRISSRARPTPPQRRASASASSLRGRLWREARPRRSTSCARRSASSATRLRRRRSPSASASRARCPIRTSTRRSSCV
jgi:hypothetical protein